MRMGWVASLRGVRPRWRRVGVVALGVSSCLLWGVLLGGCATSSEKDGERETPLGRIAALRGSGPPTRVLLISVAGLEASDFLLSDGYVARDDDRVRMRNLARLAREGVVGERALPPSPGSSYASHATIVTGRLPSRHGVVSDARIAKDGIGITPYWDSRELKGSSLWDASTGRGVMALGWPTTVGARIELLLPDATPSDSNQAWLDFIRPLASPFVVRQLEAIAEDTLSTGEEDDEDERKSTSWPTPSEKDAAISEIACHVAMSERDPSLWLIRFSQTENAQRTAGAGSLEVSAALGRIDAEIGTIIDCLEETGQLHDTAIFVVGDVAYRSVHTRVDPNVALVERGLIGRDPRLEAGIRSWLAIARSQGRSAYVYAKGAEKALEARKILEEEAERTGAFRVVSAAELAQTDVDPQAWFGLAATSGYEIGNGLVQPMRRPATMRAVAGALRSESDLSNAVGFIAWGRGIRGGLRVRELELVDIAPTIAMLIGVRLDDSVDGKPLLGILRAAVPPPPPGPKRVGVGTDGDIDRTLRDMGGGR